MSLVMKPRIAIRTPSDRDIPALVALVNVLAAENSNLFINPIDGPDGQATLKTYLDGIAVSGNEAVFVAEADGVLAGLLTATRGFHPAKRGVATIGIGVRPAYRGRGIGRALMRGIEEWAAEAGVHRLELSVVTSNLVAIALYRSCGYAEEGIMRASARVAGQPVDQLMMAKPI